MHIKHCVLLFAFLKALNAVEEHNMPEQPVPQDPSNQTLE